MHSLESQGPQVQPQDGGRVYLLKKKKKITRLHEVGEIIHSHFHEEENLSQRDLGLLVPPFPKACLLVSLSAQAGSAHCLPDHSPTCQG